MSENKKNETDLKGHKQYKKELNPPFLSDGFNMTTSSWFNERLPEMLWAVLIVGNLKRDVALKFFRYIAKYVESNQECLNVTITGISILQKEQRIKFIKYITSYSDEVNNILRALLLFPELPSFNDWKMVLPTPVSKEDSHKISEGVGKTFWHQSEAATDCRWIKFLCQIIGGKIKFSSSISDINETLRGVYEYPNYGDLRHIRPFIRAAEITPGPKSNMGDSNWARNFWKCCFDNTGCVPEEVVNKKVENRQKKLLEELENTRKHYFNETTKIRKKLINHFFETSKNSNIDSRHEGSFGLTLYGLSLFIETIFYGTALSITGRLGLRALIETYITFSYLLQKEKAEPRVWDDYRSYGTGQIKLIYLKLQEINQNLSSIELDEMDHIANEDKWVEFVPINLGHWNSANLRKMAEEVKLKELYDKFYDYTSGFMHGNWGAVRESVYQKCINPLHRYHRVPTYDLPLMPSVTKDAQQIMNNILECLSSAYATFDIRITDNKKEPPKEKKE